MFAKQTFRIILLTILLLPSYLSARVELAEQRRDVLSGTVTYVLEFESEPCATGERVETVLLPDANGEMRTVTLRGSMPNTSATSGLILHPGALRQSESFTLESSGGISESDVTVRGVSLGGVEALQVTFDPPCERAVSGRVALTGPQPDSPGRRSVHSENARIRGLFLNGGDYASVPLTVASPRRAALPDPPGEFRANYTGGNGLLAIPLEGLGIGEGDVDELEILHHGVRVPIGGVGDGSLWVYAPRRETLTDRTDSLFANTSSATPSSAIPTRPAFSTLSPLGTEAPLERTQRFEENNRYDRFLDDPIGTRFLWHRVQSPPTQSSPTTGTVELPITDIFTEAAVQLTVRINGFNSDFSYNPDHYADLVLEGVPTPRASWEGVAWFEQTYDLTLSSLPAGDGLTLDHAVPPDTPVALNSIDIQLLDWVELTWIGYPRADADGVARVSLEEAGAPRRITVGGFPPSAAEGDIVCLDVTNPQSPIRIELTSADLFTDGDGTTAVEFEAGPQAVNFHLQLLASAETPVETVPAETLPDVLGTGVMLRGIYVCPPEYEAALEPLRNLRGGNEIQFLNPQAAYNAFNGGQESPEAIRSAIAAMIDAKPSRVLFPWLLFVGHATLDPRDYLGEIEAPQVPCFISESVVTEFGTMENPIDFPYSLLSGDDDLPDAMLGRIPARTVADVELAVDRILSHDAVADSLKDFDRPGVFVADIGSTFENDQPEWTSTWEQSGNSSIRLDRADLGNNNNAFIAIRDAMEGGDAGAAYVMYSGHGFNDTWWHRNAMGSSRVEEVNTEGIWPLVATFTCLNGYYAYPGNDVLTLAEAWLFRTPLPAVYGAYANIAPCSVDYYLEQSHFSRKVLAGFALDEDDRPRSAGELMLLAQTAYATDFPFFEKTLREYILFGDPASPLAIDGPGPGSEVPDWAVWP